MDPEQAQAVARFMEKLKSEVHTSSGDALCDYIDRACKQAMWMERIDFDRCPEIEVNKEGDNVFSVTIDTEDADVQRALSKHGIMQHMEMAFG